MRRSLGAVLAGGLVAAALSVLASGASAQDPGATGPAPAGPQLPPGHPPVPGSGTDDGNGMPGRPALGPVDPDAQLPPGHPPIGGMETSPDPRGGAPGMGMRRPSGPATFAQEAPDLHAGLVEVKVVDGTGATVPSITVRLATLRNGEASSSITGTTGPDGLVRFAGLDTGVGHGYLVGAEADGARFVAPPFQLAPNAGERVQVVRYEVDHSGRAMFILEAEVQVQFREDRLAVVERFALANLSGLAMGRTPARPVAYVPEPGLRFTLPEGARAFNTRPAMGDVRVTQSNGVVLVRGTFPPMRQEPVEVAFEYQLDISAGQMDLRTTLPLPALTTAVAVEAPPGLTLSVDDLPPAEPRDLQGRRMLVTILERGPSDPVVGELRLHLGGIPSSAGPARFWAALAAVMLVLGSLGAALGQRWRGGAPGARTKEVVKAERERVLAEATELARAHRAGEVGPQSYERRRRELALWLATLLREQDAAR